MKKAILFTFIGLNLILVGCGPKTNQNQPVANQPIINVNENNNANQPKEACVDKCGDGTCQEIVCLAIGCPCAETAQTCPIDCQKNEITGSNITIQNFAFAPSNLVITKGSTVTWTNQDSVSHTITATGIFNSENLNKGQSFSYTFNTPGTFNYHCSIHPSMTGTITVQ